MLAVQPAPVPNLDIKSLVDRSTSPAIKRPTKSPAQSSSVSKRSTQSPETDDDRRKDSSDSTPEVKPGRPTLPSFADHFPPQTSPSVGQAPFPARYQHPDGCSYADQHEDHVPHPPVPPPCSDCPPFPSWTYSIPVSHALSSNKRTASPHPNESQPKKKQTKWTAAEDALIIQLRGNGMKWDEVSEHLPGRSAISCRLRFQNYLERRSEWDDEKKNRLARLYERFKKDMWEKIAKEMALPWRAAEAMHWQIGETEMANRANVSVFHLANDNQQHPPPMPTPASFGHHRADSVPHQPFMFTPPRYYSAPANGVRNGGPPYHHAHTHSLPHFPAQPAHLPTDLHRQRRPARRCSVGMTSYEPSGRPRADSARSVVILPPPAPVPIPPPGDYGGALSAIKSASTIDGYRHPPVAPPRSGGDSSEQRSTLPPPPPPPPVTFGASTPVYRPRKEPGSR